MIAEKLKYQTHWTIKKYASDEDFEAGKHFHVAEIDGNILLNEGIGALLDLLCGIGSPTTFSNANAFIGVGDSSTAESAAHTGLQAPTNKLYRAMQSGYPSRSGQTVTFRAVYASADANYAWNEFTIANGNSDAAVNLNRRVSAQGTKASGQTWTVDVSITLS